MKGKAVTGFDVQIGEQVRSAQASSLSLVQKGEEDRNALIDLDARFAIEGFHGGADEWPDRWKLTG
ncbi:hypothetical protein BMI86_10155 [Thioclava sp. DLFJ5-1]|uniref:hypothetical protein n=1 Tax=Thioclava sp. DLFJ5-1 TaxID=1915314 RepID=UPI0009D05349|nr:hypothetical protein [Thioclava sp. DLFJ5-1]OOY20860.1 hypothetical protein BMI86_10155 [Thioclava sp. DLFJ5-1]